MTEREREMLIEAATTDWRPHTPNGRMLENPSWADLDAAGRSGVRGDLLMRILEAARVPDGSSMTVRAVAAGIAGK